MNKNLRLFVVDDDPFWCAILTEILNDLGYHNVTSYYNGKDCIDHLHLNPAVVFLDKQMDGIDGIDALKEIKQYYPGINVIMCTALEDLGVAMEAIKNGSNEYLLKTNSNKKEVASIMESLGFTQ